MSYHTYWQFADTFKLHDVHFAAQMFRQMTVNPERDHTVSALEGSRIVCGRSSECSVDVDLVKVAHGPLVLLQMALCSEADSACIASEGPLKVMNVDVEPQLRGLREHFLADPAYRLAVLVCLENLLRIC